MTTLKEFLNELKKQTVSKKVLADKQTAWNVRTHPRHLWTTLTMHNEKSTWKIRENEMSTTVTWYKRMITMNDGFHGSSTFIFPVISLIFSIFISFTFLEIKQMYQHFRTHSVKIKQDYYMIVIYYHKTSHMKFNLPK